ncbi:uncharacterized protein [Rutidosis leptorrhynchoides]|uniref:uncharacterized protein n=1 Tax=Rutidosis leptorrhynchoides TaxID=125765 RepID=UPI003A995E4A
MASLKPGVLSNLLKNINDPTVKLAGDHRSPLLQVIGIVPRDDVFDFDKKNKGFYLRVSDSVHSAYVSVQECDVELILNDKIQLGQFVHVTRLVSGSPVPVLCGVKPVAKRRACVGEPKDLISSDVLVSKNEVVKVKNKGGNLRRLSLVSNNGGSGKVCADVESRRLSLDYSSRKGWDRLSPVQPVKHRKSSSDARLVDGASPKCSTPVRFVKKASSVKDVSLKPPNLWDRSPLPAVKHRRSGSDLNYELSAKLVEPSSPLCSTPVRSVRKASSVKDLVLKPPNMNLAPLKNKNVIVSEKLISKPIKKDLKTSFDCIQVPTNLTKVPISARPSSDSKVSWDFVSPAICEFGKEAIGHRNLRFSSAVQALEETSAMDNILQCMSVFAEICEHAQTSKYPLVEQFLNFYQRLQTSAAIVNALIDSKSTVDKPKGQPSNSALWVQAAIDTNLAKFTLFSMEENSNNNLCSEGNYHVVLDNTSQNIQVENQVPENKTSPKTRKPVTSRVRHTGSKTNIERSNESGLKEAGNLAEKLLLTSRKWFLTYLEDSLNKGFGLTKGEDSGVAVGLLGQLKRVNQWLDGSAREDEKVDSLRKKLYGFLLDHIQKPAK